MARFTGVLGILAVLLAAYLFSTDRRHIRWRTIVWGLGLQFTFAFLVLRFDYGQRLMSWAGGVVTNMLSATFAGTQVLFGQLGLPNSGAFGNLLGANKGAIFAFQVLPTIIFISAFFAVLYHIGLMQIIIRGMAWVMLKTMRISGAESMNVAAPWAQHSPMFGHLADWRSAITISASSLVCAGSCKSQLTRSRWLSRPTKRG